jgi:hypothetical protein
MDGVAEVCGFFRAQDGINLKTRFEKISFQITPKAEAG